MFACYFKDEVKKFVYSTGEKIIPKNWDFENRFVFTAGKNKSKSAESIKKQLNRYSDLFVETESLYKRIGEPFTTEILKKTFDKAFKKTVKGKDIFFSAFDLFMEEKINGKEWSEATIKRYSNIKNILKTDVSIKSYKIGNTWMSIATAK